MRSFRSSKESRSELSSPAGFDDDVRRAGGERGNGSDSRPVDAERADDDDRDVPRVQHALDDAKPGLVGQQEVERDDVWLAALAIDSASRRSSRRRRRRGADRARCRRTSTRPAVGESSTMSTRAQRALGHATSLSTVSSSCVSLNRPLTMYASAPSSRPRRRSSSFDSEVMRTNGVSARRSVALHARAELPAVHVRHLDVAHDAVELHRRCTLFQASTPSTAVSTS